MSITAHQIVPEVLYAPAQVSKLLGKKESTLARWRMEGAGPRYVKVGRTPCYRGAAILEWLASSERQSTSEAA